MKVKSLKGDRLFDAVSVVIGVIMLLIIIYPLYFIVIASFSSPAAVANGEVWLFPKSLTLEGYKMIFEDERIWSGYKNTIIFTVVGTLISLIFTLPAAYSLSRPDLKGRNIIMMYFVITMFFSGGLIPTYLTIRDFGLIDTFWVVVLPFSVSVYNIIISRTFFASNIPLELLESAKLDGCSNTRFLLRIVLPLSKAIVAVIALYCAVGQWNQYFISLVYTRSKELVPLQMVIRDILLKGKAMSEGMGSIASTETQRIIDQIQYGVIIVTSVPIMCVYPFIQKHFTQGVMIGSVKG